MKAIILLLTVCTVVSTGYGQSKEIQPVLNETWNWHVVCCNRSESKINDTVLPIARIPASYFQKGCPNPIVHFNADSTFKIDFCFYGESMGYQHKIFEGQYTYNPNSEEILLTFKRENAFNADASTVYRALKGLSTGSAPWFSLKERKKAPVYSKALLKIVQQSGTKINVDLYACTEEGKKNSYGSVSFIRKTNNKNK